MKIVKDPNLFKASRMDDSTQFVKTIGQEVSQSEFKLPRDEPGNDFIADEFPVQGSSIQRNIEMKNATNMQDEVVQSVSLRPPKRASNNASITMKSNLEIFINTAMRNIARNRPKLDVFRSWVEINALNKDSNESSLHKILVQESLTPKNSESLWKDLLDKRYPRSPRKLQSALLKYFWSW
ncbi:hypothetical protein BC829DRAFT_448512 [Chytridium lagenaria]|nr:hypothetical protein BC829DRAFT_448512 [Chytridium lagenaria]